MRPGRSRSRVSRCELLIEAGPGPGSWIVCLRGASADREGEGVENSRSVEVERTEVWGCASKRSSGRPRVWTRRGRPECARGASCADALGGAFGRPRSAPCEAQRSKISRFRGGGALGAARRSGHSTTKRAVARDAPRPGARQAYARRSARLVACEAFGEAPRATSVQTYRRARNLKRLGVTYFRVRPQ